MKLAAQGSLQFLEGGSEMGRLIREKDWSHSPLGKPEEWPQSLLTTLSIMLHSRFPMFLFWGPHSLCFYNDAYRPSLGKDGKHSSILGMPAKEAWPEIWNVIKPLIDQVMGQGKATWSEDQLIPIYRNGQLEDVYWTFSHSPVHDESGLVAGVFVTCTETTEKVLAYKSLEESKNQLEFAIKATELGTWDYDPATGRFSANQRLLDWFGLAESDSIALADALKAIADTDRQRVVNAITAALAGMGGGLYDEEYCVINPETKTKTIVHTKGRAWFTEDKVAYRFNGTMEDVTEQTLLNNKIKESEQRFRFLADSLPQHVWTANSEGMLTYFNRSVFDFSGLTPEELANGGWINIVHPDDRAENMKRWALSVETGADFLFEHRFKKHTGQYRWQLSRAIAQIDESGKIQLWVGTSTDIHDQKTFANQLEAEVAERTKDLHRINESLRKSEERYHLMVEEVQEYAILYLSTEGTVENWNKGAEKIKGYAAQEIIGRNFSVFYTAQDRENNLPQSLLNLARQTGRARQEGWRVRKDNTLFWASVLITAVHNEQREVIGFSKVTHDLTEKKKADDTLKRNAQELEQKNAELQKLNKELESFAYISSHDLQEPLRKIQAFSSRIVDKELANLSESGKDYFARMQSAARRMQTLITDLLSYSRANVEVKKLEETDLALLVEEVKVELAEEIKQKHATIEANNLGKLHLIRFQFSQVLHNLISNSLKFSAQGRPPAIVIEGSMATVSTTDMPGLAPNKTYFCIRYTDNGIGFESQYQEKIFELFQRLHGRDTYDGTGIGLAIVKKIIDNHHGLIRAISKPGEGATFEIYIPVGATPVTG